MKVLILLTGHRHNQEFKLCGLCLDKCKKLKQYCDVFIHNNKIDNDIVLNVQYIKTNKRIYNTDQNDGFLNGGLEAVSDCIEMLNLKSEDCKYDWVLHMHPDVFIINEGPILKLLTQELNTDNVFYVNYSLNNKVLYSFDFFLWKPKLLNINILKDWRESVISPEYYLYQQINKHKIKHILVERYSNNWYMPRRLDHLGLYHEHDLGKVYDYIT